MLSTSTEFFESDYQTRTSRFLQYLHIDPVMLTALLLLMAAGLLERGNTRVFMKTVICIGDCMTGSLTHNTNSKKWRSLDLLWRGSGTIGPVDFVRGKPISPWRLPVSLANGAPLVPGGAKMSGVSSSDSPWLRYPQDYEDRKRGTDREPYLKERSVNDWTWTERRRWYRDERKN